MSDQLIQDFENLMERMNKFYSEVSLQLEQQYKLLNEINEKLDSKTEAQ